jgi:ketosteroid isomerase-like protein
MKLKSLFLIGLVVSSTSCLSQKKITDNKLKILIIEKYEKMRATIQSGDPNYVIKMHTDDATLFKSDGTELNGIQQLGVLYKQVATSGIDIKSTPISVEKLSQDTAFEVGQFVSTTKDGKINSSKYIIIWKKVGNDWKIYKSIDQAKIMKVK